MLGLGTCLAGLESSSQEERGGGHPRNGFLTGPCPSECKQWVCVGGVRESKTWAGGLNSDQGEELRVLRLGTSTEYWGIRAPVRKAEDLFHTKAIIGCDCPWDGRQMELSPKPGSRKGRA